MRMNTLTAKAFDGDPSVNRPPEVETWAEAREFCDELETRLLATQQIYAALRQEFDACQQKLQELVVERDRALGILNDALQVRRPDVSQAAKDVVELLCLSVHERDSVLSGSTRDKALAMLKRVEWYARGHEDSCLECHNLKRFGHADDCDLGRLIRELEAGEHA
jgi:hypothetical protein